jgi:AcrR family transcriptional regulator
MSTPGLREQKKARTRAAIQQAALGLIETQGYDVTTCEQIAAAAEVSPATFYRYFPTKEDVVLSDDYDPMIAELVRRRPVEEPPLMAVRGALREALGAGGPDEEAVRHRTRLVLSVPALRARSHEQVESLRGHLAGALAARVGAEEDAVAVQVLAAAAAAALGVGVEAWAEHGGALADRVDEALAVLAAGAADGR